MKDFIINFFIKFAKSLRKVSIVEENHCRRCGLCHHACKILKNKSLRKFQEE